MGEDGQRGKEMGEVGEMGWRDTRRRMLKTDKVEGVQRGRRR
jgi:hypothetical protein